MVHASLRSVSGFFGALFVALFWNGIVSIFVLIALAGLYANLVGPLPKWFPAPELEPSMPLGMTLFLCLFLTPFVAVGSVLAGALLLNAAGKIEVSIADDEASVRTGVGFLVWRRRFDPAKVRGVSLGVTSWQTNGQPSQVIVIEADRTVKFGSLLQEERREWVQAILHQLLIENTSNRRKDLPSMAKHGAGA
jgi:hypothetical protein